MSAAQLLNLTSPKEFQFLAPSSNLSPYLSKAVPTEVYKADLAALTSSAVNLEATAFNSATVFSKIYLALAEAPETLKPNKPESEKWKFTASAASIQCYLFNKLDYNLQVFNKVVNTFKAVISADFQFTPQKNKPKSNLLDSVKFLTSPPTYLLASLLTVYQPSTAGMKDNFYYTNYTNSQ